MKTLKWTREHKSTDGRFTCLQACRSKTWTLYDSATRDQYGASASTCHTTLAEARERAERIAAQTPGKPLINVV